MVIHWVEMTRHAHLSVLIGTTDALLYGGAGIMWQQALCNSDNLHGQLSRRHHDQRLQCASLISLALPLKAFELSFCSLDCLAEDWQQVC